MLTRDVSCGANGLNPPNQHAKDVISQYNAGINANYQFYSDPANQSNDQLANVNVPAVKDPDCNGTGDTQS